MLTTSLWGLKYQALDWASRNDFKPCQVGCFPCHALQVAAMISGSRTRTQLRSTPAKWSSHQAREQTLLSLLPLQRENKQQQDWAWQQKAQVQPQPLSIFHVCASTSAWWHLGHTQTLNSVSMLVFPSLSSEMLEGPFRRLEWSREPISIVDPNADFNRILYNLMLSKFFSIERILSLWLEKNNKTLQEEVSKFYIGFITITF